MGPSGSGKSTLLYSVSGMDRPTAGEVILSGKRITDLKEKELAKVRLTSVPAASPDCPGHPLQALP